MLFRRLNLTAGFSGPLHLNLTVRVRPKDTTALMVLIYGHGDTVRGLDSLWREGLSSTCSRRSSAKVLAL